MLYCLVSYWLSHFVLYNIISYINVSYHTVLPPIASQRIKKITDEETSHSNAPSCLFLFIIIFWRTTVHKGPSNYRFSTQENKGTISRRAPPGCQRSVPGWGKILLTRLVHLHFLFVGFLSASLQCQPGYLTSECCGLNQCLLSFPLGCSEDSKWGGGGEGGILCTAAASNISSSTHSLCVDKIWATSLIFTARHIVHI